jgi:hypothetical protein
MAQAAMTYDEILSQIRQLAPDEQGRLLGELAVLVTQQPGERRSRSILELQGLGKEIWEGIDAQEYVRQERASWSG